MSSSSSSSISAIIAGGMECAGKRASRSANPDLPGGNMDERQAAALVALVESGTLTRQDASDFQEIHDRLVESGLME